MNSLMINNCWMLLEEFPTFSTSIRLFSYVNFMMIKRNELFIMAIKHCLCLWDFLPVWYLWCLIKEELYLKTFLHYSTTSLWSFCPPTSGLYQLWHFLFALSEQTVQKYFALGLTSLFQTSTPGLHRYLVELLTLPFRALPLAPVGLLILVWKREKPHNNRFL